MLSVYVIYICLPILICSQYHEIWRWWPTRGQWTIRSHLDQEFFQSINMHGPMGQYLPPVPISPSSPMQYYHHHYYYCTYPMMTYYWPTYQLMLGRPTTTAAITQMGMVVPAQTYTATASVTAPTTYWPSASPGPVCYVPFGTCCNHFIRNMECDCNRYHQQQLISGSIISPPSFFMTKDQDQVDVPAPAPGLHHLQTASDVQSIQSVTELKHDDIGSMDSVISDLGDSNDDGWIRIDLAALGLMEPSSTSTPAIQEITYSVTTAEHSLGPVIVLDDVPALAVADEDPVTECEEQKDAVPGPVEGPLIDPIQAEISQSIFVEGDVVQHAQSDLDDEASNERGPGSSAAPIFTACRSQIPKKHKRSSNKMKRRRRSGQNRKSHTSSSTSTQTAYWPTEAVSSSSTSKRCNTTTASNTNPISSSFSATSTTASTSSISPEHAPDTSISELHAGRLLTAILRLDENHENIGPLSHLLLDLYNVRLAKLPDTEMVVDRDYNPATLDVLRHMKTFIRMNKVNGHMTDLARSFIEDLDVARTIRLLHMDLLMDILTRALSIDPAGVRHSLLNNDTNVLITFRMMQTSMQMRPLYYRERRQCWPVSELADTLEQTVLELGMLAQDLHQNLMIRFDEEVCGKAAPAVKEFISVATDSIRVLAVVGVVNACDVLDPGLRDELDTHLRQRLDQARDDPDAYFRVLDMASRFKSSLSPPQVRPNTDSDLDDEDRDVIARLDSIVNKSEPLDLPEVSLPESFNMQSSSRDIVQQLSRHVFQHDLIMVTKACIAKSETKISAIRNEITLWLFDKYERYDGQRFVDIGIQICRLACEKVLYVKRSTAVALTATMNRRVGLFINLVERTMLEAGYLNCNMDALAHALRRSLQEHCRGVMKSQNDLERDHTILELLANCLYQAVPMCQVRDIAHLGSQQLELVPI